MFYSTEIPAGLSLCLSLYYQLLIRRPILPVHAQMRVSLRATAIAAAPALAPATGLTSAAAGGGVGLGYGIAIAVGILVLISTVMLASYLCILTKAGAALLAADAPVGPPTSASSPTAVVPGLDGAAIDALYPKYPHAGSGDDGPSRVPGCGHGFHASCAELWLRVSATCPVCRDSPVPSPAATPLAEAVVPLAAHAHFVFDSKSPCPIGAHLCCSLDEFDRRHAPACSSSINLTHPLPFLACCSTASPAFFQRSHPSLDSSPSSCRVDMESPGPEVFSLGFRFDPKPLDVINYYLPRLIADAPLHVAMRPFVHHADVYAGEPGELAHLFRPLPRATLLLHQPQASAAEGREGNQGHARRGRRLDVLDKDNKKVGEVTKLRYKKGGKYTDWLMDEYSCGLQDAIVGGDRQLAFCNIYVSPRARQDSVAHQESAAFFAPPPPSAPVVVMAQAAAANPKRPVAPPKIASPPCPKRMRVAAVAPSHQVVQLPRPCVPHYGVAPPSSAPSVTRPSPASAQTPAPAPTRLAMQPPAPPRKLGQPKQQQQPTPTPPVVHMPVQAPALHCRPQASVQRILDPLEAMRDEAGDEGESPAALQDGDDDGSLEDALAEAEAEDEAAANSEGSPMSFDDMVQLLEKEILLVPKEEILA
ncbi:hypothetical protein HU200_030397 [Digitaria exilis]|uniref:RING-type domain-containing protein n=1 Tax=Digitaria exilis TaxID=1010633 RepID=A0A835EQV8_9POAL|nr:hypothetical protein HU200_030397 [Digitaria exilis]